MRNGKLKVWNQNLQYTSMRKFKYERNHRFIRKAKNVLIQKKEFP